MDQIVWTEVIRLLEDPTLIQQELDRRLAVARAADPTKAREQTVQRELVRVGKSIERLLTAYQEDLVSLEQLRERMPRLREREQTLRTELHAMTEQTRDRAAYLRLAETLAAFLTRLRGAADTLDIGERQRIVRPVVKDVLVGADTIVIRHCIPVPSGPPHGSSRRGATPMTAEMSEVTFCVRGVVSPLLANIYLHHVLDVWFTTEVQPRLRGRSVVVRYADDVVIVVQRNLTPTGCWTCSRNASGGSASRCIRRRAVWFGSADRAVVGSLSRTAAESHDPARSTSWGSRTTGASPGTAAGCSSERRPRTAFGAV